MSRDHTLNLGTFGCTSHRPSLQIVWECASVRYNDYECNAESMTSCTCGGCLAAVDPSETVIAHAPAQLLNAMALRRARAREIVHSAWSNNKMLW